MYTAYHGQNTVLLQVEQHVQQPVQQRVFRAVTAVQAYGASAGVGRMCHYCNQSGHIKAQCIKGIHIGSAYLPCTCCIVSRLVAVVALSDFPSTCTAGLYCCDILEHMSQDNQSRYGPELGCMLPHNQAFKIA